MLSLAQGVGQSINKVGNWSNSLALTETSVTPDGNYLVRLANNSGEEFTISNVKIGDTNANYSADLFQGNAQNFVIDSSDACSSGDGVTKQVTITFVSKNGITKTEIYPVDTYFSCENYTVSLLANQCEVCSTLVWSDENATGDTWYNHTDNCARMNTADFDDPGYVGWRLPTVDELDAVKASYPNEDLWTSSPVPSDTSYAYVLSSVYLDITDAYAKAINSNGARCVRST